jgi:polysaccharide biosynthesis protein PslH
MQLLLITGSVPYPPLQGGALRSFGLIKGLHAAGHHITLLTFGDPTQPIPAPLAERCVRVEVVATPPRPLLRRLFDLVGGRADLAERLYSDAAAQRLRALLASYTFDLIQADGLEVAAYLPLAKQLQPSAKLCYDSFNAEYALQAAMSAIDRTTPRRWPLMLYSSVQAQRIRQFEGDICRLCDLVLAVSPEDAAELGKLIPTRTIPIVPNGIESDAYHSSRNTPLDLGTFALVFTGTLDYRPNIDAVLWFAEAVFPQVRAATPEAHWYIVGQRVHPRVQALAGTAGISITGQVPSVTPYLQGAAIYVVPMRMGGGTRLKVLEAMAAKCAIVSTRIGASGLQAAAHNALWIADTPADFTRAILTLHTDSARRHTLGASAAAFVRTHYDWSVLIPQLLDAYARII